MSDICHEMRPRPCKADIETFLETFNLPAIWPQQTWAEHWEAVALFCGGELGPHLARGLGRDTMWHLDALALQ